MITPKSEPKNLTVASLSTASHSKTYRIPIPLPQTAAANRFIGSPSDGFLISVDAVADLHVINPLSGAHFPLPPTSTLPGIAGVERDPSSGQITSYSFHYEHPIWIFASCEDSTSERPPSWSRTTSSSGGPPWPLSFTEAADGLHLPGRGTPLGPPLISPSSAVLNCSTTSSSTGAVSTPSAPRGRLQSTSSDQPVRVSCTLGYTRDLEERSLVESPDGDELFMATRIFKHADTFISEKKYTVTKVKLARFVVSKLDESGGKWKEVQGLGDYALFLGSSSVCSLFESWPPYLTRSYIYFSHNFQNGGQGLGVFDLGDESIKQVDLRVDRRQLTWSLPPLWFTPVLALP